MAKDLGRITSLIDNRLYLASAKHDAVDLQTTVHFCNLLEGWESGGPCSQHVSPMSLTAVLYFNRMLLEELDSQEEGESIVCCVNSLEPSKIFLARFLMGAFLVCHDQKSPSDALCCLRKFDPHGALGGIGSALSSEEEEKGLELMAAWRALSHGRSLGWMDELDLSLEEMLHYTNNLEGGCFWIVPNRLLVLQSPLEVPGLYLDRPPVRFFSARFYLTPFRDMNIRTVVGIEGPNSPPASLQGNASAGKVFQAAGLHSVCLDLDDDELPPCRTMLEFLYHMSSAAAATPPHAVAVHCPTGTIQSALLAAIYLMSAHGFDACAAAAWVRLGRPGALTPPHEAFLQRLGRVAAASSDLDDSTAHLVAASSSLLWRDRLGWAAAAGDWADSVADLGLDPSESELEDHLQSCAGEMDSITDSETSDTDTGDCQDGPGCESTGRGSDSEWVRQSRRPGFDRVRPESSYEWSHSGSDPLPAADHHTGSAPPTRTLSQEPGGHWQGRAHSESATEKTRRPPLPAVALDLSLDGVGDGCGGTGSGSGGGPVLPRAQMVDKGLARVGACWSKAQQPTAATAATAAGDSKARCAVASFWSLWSWTGWALAAGAAHGEEEHAPQVREEDI